MIVLIWSSKILQVYIYLIVLNPKIGYLWCFMVEAVSRCAKGSFCGPWWNFVSWCVSVKMASLLCKFIELYIYKLYTFSSLMSVLLLWLILMILCEEWNYQRFFFFLSLVISNVFKLLYWYQTKTKHLKY